MAIEILERNHDKNTLVILGINNNGTRFAKILMQHILDIPYGKNKDISLANIFLNPAAPLASDIELSIPKDSLKDKSILLVDDVANTGRTMFYACKPLLDVIPQSIELAVLVDRKHKNFPIVPNYVGLALATTLKENIKVSLEENAYTVSLLEKEK